MDKTPRTDVVAKLRYMARQYTNGQIARGGNPQKHYLDEAADEIETLRKRADDAEKDAKRYRLILQHCAITDFIFGYLKSKERHVSNAIDEAFIDAEMDTLAPLPPGHVCVPVELVPAINALLHQLDIGTFFDEHGHSAKMLKPVHDLMRLLSAVKEPVWASQGEPM